VRSLDIDQGQGRKFQGNDVCFFLLCLAKWVSFVFLCSVIKARREKGGPHSHGEEPFHGPTQVCLSNGRAGHGKTFSIFKIRIYTVSMVFVRLFTVFFLFFFFFFFFFFYVMNMQILITSNIFINYSNFKFWTTYLPIALKVLSTLVALRPLGRWTSFELVWIQLAQRKTHDSSLLPRNGFGPHPIIFSQRI
jgi:hypothetical protein